MARVGACTSRAAGRAAGRAADGGVTAALPVRLVRRRLPAGEREHPHTHAFVEICHVQSGRGVLHVGGRSLVAAAQTATVLAPGAMHALAADGGWACSANLLHFEARALPTPEDREALAGLLRLAGAGRASASLRAGAGPVLAQLIVKVGALARQEGAAATCRAALGELCQRLLRHLRDARTAAPRAAAGTPRPQVAPLAASRPEIEQVLAYIESNLSRPISRQDLARQAAFAPSYFSALFREATGTTIPEYINARRVHRAQDLLRDPQTRVSAVCYAVGFRDLSNFNRVFKRLVGCTPREYRRSVLGEGFDGEEPDEARIPEAGARDEG